MNLNLSKPRPMVGAKISDSTLRNQRLLPILAVYPPLHDQAAEFGKPCSDHVPPLTAVGRKPLPSILFPKRVAKGSHLSLGALGRTCVQGCFDEGNRLLPPATFCTGDEVLTFAAKAVFSKGLERCEMAHLCGRHRFLCRLTCAIFLTCFSKIMPFFLVLMSAFVAGSVS